MDYIPVKSSLIVALAYDATSRALGVRFTSGKEYRYFNVPAALYRALLDASSVGGLFERMVKQAGYDFERIR